MTDLSRTDQLTKDIIDIAGIAAQGGYETGFAAGRLQGIKEAAEVVRNRGPASQDMTSTLICEALGEAATAIEALAKEAT